MIKLKEVAIERLDVRVFHEGDEELLNNLIKISVEGTRKVTHAILPCMLKRKRDAIEFWFGSCYCDSSDPLYAVYAATKAYVDQFSRFSYVEYNRSGIDL
ncbi:hypothetical protein HHK36_010529 [Tetracentron sinense]|uniref:Uncharacterized protein n=1 Tax=Tetracentron sinense TaxID=13715 RepID=A0A834ZNP6_TETSI|nr:hypothetical protein HHK36_010529 [Tetracentron sinense]